MRSPDLFVPLEEAQQRFRAGVVLGMLAGFAMVSALWILVWWGGR